MRWTVPPPVSRSGDQSISSAAVSCLRLFGDPSPLCEGVKQENRRDGEQRQKEQRHHRQDDCENRRDGGGSRLGGRNEMVAQPSREQGGDGARFHGQDLHQPGYSSSRN